MYDTSYYGESSINPISTIVSLFSSGISIIISLGICLLTFASLWKIFEKFGKEGWKAIIPVYNIIVLFEIAEMKPWYVALALIPCVGPFILMVFMIIAYAKIAKKLGKDGSFVLLIIFLSPIALALLAFGKDNRTNNNPNSNNLSEQNNFQPMMDTMNQVSPMQEMNQQTPQMNMMNNQMESVNVPPIPPMANNIMPEQTTTNTIEPMANSIIPEQTTTSNVIEPMVMNQPIQSVSPVVENNMQQEARIVEEEQPTIVPNNSVPIPPVDPIAPMEPNTISDEVAQANQVGTTEISDTPSMENIMPNMGPIPPIEPSVSPVQNDVSINPNSFEIGMETNQMNAPMESAIPNVVEPTIASTPMEPSMPIEPIAPIVEEQAPIVPPTMSQSETVQPVSEQIVDPLQNIEPPIIPTINDGSDNNNM